MIQIAKLKGESMTAKATRSPEKFLEEIAVGCVLIKAKFDLDVDGQRWVRLDFESPVRDCYKHLPENMQLAFDSISNAGAIKTEFEPVFEKRMIEIYFDAKKKPSRVIDCATISKVQFRRKDTEHEMKLRFSVTESASAIGHWVVDHFGDPMYFRAISTQMELPT
jgi:hypothetical protein